MNRLKVRRREFAVDEAEVPFYRDRTMGLLRRYFRASIELGRLPSVIGREFFRAKVTSYQMHSFEDVVILVHDVERSMEKLGRFHQELISRVVFQDYSQDEASKLLGCTRRHLVRMLPDAVDELTKIFLRSGLLRREEAPRKSCQGEEKRESKLSA